MLYVCIVVCVHIVICIHQLIDHSCRNESIYNNASSVQLIAYR